jgi:hypothetical protein
MFADSFSDIERNSLATVKTQSQNAVKKYKVSTSKFSNRLASAMRPSHFVFGN